ncbi:hypothetical protein Dimus_007323, partial [Dionaea muscipula]
VSLSRGVLSVSHGRISGLLSSMMLGMSRCCSYDYCDLVAHKEGFAHARSDDSCALRRGVVAGVGKDAQHYARPYAMLVLEPCPSMGRVVGMASARVVPVVILSSAMCWAWRSVVVAATILDGMEGIGLGCARLRGMPDVPVAGEEPADGDLLARRAPELGLEPYLAMSYAWAMSISLAISYARPRVELGLEPMLGHELGLALFGRRWGRPEVMGLTSDVDRLA